MRNIVEEIEDIPCGQCITTKTLDQEGNVIRQDITIKVSEEVAKQIFGCSGEIGE